MKNLSVCDQIESPEPHIGRQITQQLMNLLDISTTGGECGAATPVPLSKRDFNFLK